MAYNPRPFDYSLRPFDATDLSVETADILDVRDNQLTNYLQTETASIKKETDDLATDINNIVTAPGDWDTSHVPVLRRGSTTVTTSVATSAYCQNAYLVFFKCEIEVTSAVSFPGNQVMSISLPIGCSTNTRVIGTGMYLDGDATPVFYLFKAFIEDFNVSNMRAAFIVDRGLNWLGQNVTGSPTISGVRTGDRWYLDVCYRPA
jgi:hypothetical protein